jgi:hypothetical protein
VTITYLIEKGKKEEETQKNTREGKGVTEACSIKRNNIYYLHSALASIVIVALSAFCFVFCLLFLFIVFYILFFK